MIGVKKKSYNPPLPPKPFWKMTIPELNKYSKQMILYDKEINQPKKKINKRKKRKTRKNSLPKKIRKTQKKTLI